MNRPPANPGHDGSDVGLEVVHAIAEMMAIDEEWSTFADRGFTWWGKDYAQRVWSEPGLDDDGIEIFRLHARAPVLRDFDPSDENLAKLNALAMFATMSAFVIDPDARTVELGAGMYTHEQSADWVRKWFGMAVALQAADAQSKAALLAEVTGATPATSSHPTSGQRPHPDDMLGTLENVPRAQEPCPWQGEAMLQILAAVRSGTYTVLATGDEHGMTQELPFQSETSLLTVTTEAPNPQLGNGALVLLRLPVTFAQDEGVRFASELNRRELAELTRAQFLGSWCWRDDFLSFVAFLPNLLHTGGADLLNFVISSGARAKWVAERIYSDDWASNRDESGRPLATPAIADALAEHAFDRVFDEADSGQHAGAHSDRVLEGMRLAAEYDVDLVELANSIIAQVSEAHAESETGTVWFPAEAIRALCCMEFLVASELSDPRLDDAFKRSALSPSEEATSNVSEIGQRVVEERGLTPVIDALLELIRDQDAPPASELL